MNTYYYKARPPGIGCQPSGWTIREPWLPAHEINGRLFLGLVEYAEPLSAEQIRRYGLWPASELERAKLILAAEPAWIRESYMAYDVDFLEARPKSDQLAKAALILKR